MEAARGEVHDPAKCTGLAELRARLEGMEELQEEFSARALERFTLWRESMDRELASLQATIEDHRRMSVGGTQTLEVRTGETLKHSSENFREVFGQIRDLKAGQAEMRPHVAGIPALQKAITDVERRLSNQWIVIMLLSLLSLGKGIAWLAPFVQQLIGLHP